MKGHTVLCSYRVKQDKDEEFLRLLLKHWPALRQFGLVTDEASALFRADGCTCRIPARTSADGIPVHRAD